MRRAGVSGLFLTLATQCLFAAIFLGFPHLVTKLYTDDPEVQQSAATLLRLAGIFQLFDGLQVLGIGALRGLLDVRIPFLATVVSYWLVGAPVSLLLCFTAGHGAPGLWYGMVAGLGVAALLHVIRFHKLTWK